MKIEFQQTEVSEIAKKILSQLDSKILCFYGPMGAGKTTLIKTLIKELGVIDSGTSPTFGLVNEYENAQGQLIAYHFDFYRIENETEVLDMGIEDYFSSDTHIFIEWPEKIPSLLPLDHHKIQLQFIDESTRNIEF